LKIKGRKFSRSIDLEPSGSLKVEGAFKSAKKAGGTIDYNSGGCLGDYRFTAKR
jgi:hypothetical protein